MVQRIMLWLSVVVLVLGLWLLGFTPAEPKDLVAPRGTRGRRPCVVSVLPLRQRRN